MTTRLITYLMVSVFLLSFSACSKKDNGIDKSKYLSLYKMDFELQKAVMWHRKNNVINEQQEYIFKDTYINADGNSKTDDIKGFSSVGTLRRSGNFTVSLYGKNVVYNSEKNITTGEGPVITIHFSSENLNELKEGTYTFGEVLEPNTFFAYSSGAYNFNSSGWYDYAKPNKITEGSITVEKSGNKYIFNLSCKTALGASIEGRYDGDIQMVNESNSGNIIYEKDNYLEAALDTVTVIGWQTTKEPDRISMCLYSSIKNTISTIYSVTNMDEYNQKLFDLALFCNEDTGEFTFEPPIKVRAKTWHGMFYRENWWDGKKTYYNYQLPCYSIIDNNPSYLTNEQFDKIENDSGFNFDVVENNAPFTKDDLPHIITFKTGNGIKGAIKVTSITKGAMKEDVSWTGNVTKSTVGPKVNFEIKMLESSRLMNIK